MNTNPSMQQPDGIPPEEWSRLWAAVDSIIDTAPSLADLREQGLDLLAATRWRGNAYELPEELVLEERRAALRTLAVGPLLNRVRDSVDVQPMLFKGPELAQRYRDPVARRFSDVDLLVPDPAAAQHALISAGFRETGDPRLYENIHHLRPLVWPGLPLAVELHGEPKWIAGRPAPRYRDLLEGSLPTVCDVAGVLAPAPADHAVLVAVHSWAHEPLRRLSDLIDVGVLICGLDAGELEAAASRFGVSRVWSTTVAALNASLYGGRRSFATRTWARGLATVRRRTVFESHLTRLLSPFGAGPPLAAGLTALAAAGDLVLPAPGEAWPKKLRRARVALHHAGDSRSEHDQALGRRGLL